MIYARYEESGGELKLEVKGHAGYAPAGQDIVCAAVSCLVQTLLYTLEANQRTASSVEDTAEGPCVTVLVRDAVPEDYNAMGFVCTGLGLLAQQCPENVSFASRNPGELFDLQLFAEGGDGEAAADGEETSQQRSVSDDAAARSSPDREAKNSGGTARSRSREAAAAEVDEMLEPAETDEEGSDDPDARRKEFGRLMREQYPRELSEIIVRSTQEAYKELTGEKSPVGRILSALGQKYGTAPGDLEALAAAVEGGVVKDDAYYEDMAMKKGISVQLAKEMDALESENAQHRAAEHQREEAAKMAAIQQEWDAAVERIQAQDPGFDIQAALADPDFAQMLKLGVSMEDAYKARYFDDIMARRTVQTAKTVEKGVEARIRQRGARPSENGVNPGGAAVLKTDVSKLTLAQCEELERRARRGQVITF